MKKIHQICVIGAGRIGRLHAQNICERADAQLRCVVDINDAAAEQLAKELGARWCSLDEALNDAEIDAVVIASSTDTHVNLIQAAARAGKAVFCEKPIDLDSEKVKACLNVVERCSTPLFVGFNRRFDPNFQQLHKAINDKSIGDLEMIQITSRDPGPPPSDYIRVSGGLFRDMMIHDLDMARWLLGEEPVEVYATGSCLVDSAIAEHGDIDSALVTLKTASGKLCQISNSRRAAYGYDQRIEILGSQGMIQAENVSSSSVVIHDKHGIRRDLPPYFFLDRYHQAYKIEMNEFIDSLNGQPPKVTGIDGAKALELADAAHRSFLQGRPVQMPPESEG
ncbi:inositol 2-dehydrogenase [Porticoccus sp. W117]|uniref:inositol 2-dehydrogenase n=1 Tax=Porticoccus sp. W117 TaxID=3054777 RepID=UPI00259A9E5A|nr:inositol 2-dehydrogenase [Porticoccus sp. W117]MDM3870092.1 inositol 2-dehydrogenase [Porticoccus sp. W117]